MARQRPAVAERTTEPAGQPAQACLQATNLRANPSPPEVAAVPGTPRLRSKLWRSVRHYLGSALYTGSFLTRCPLCSRNIIPDFISSEKETRRETIQWPK